MTPADCEALVTAYSRWLHGGLTAELVGDSCELTTPFLDRHNDHLQIYATRRNGEIILSDDGYILSDLQSTGLELNTPKRMQTLTTVLNGFGVKRDEHDALYVRASERDVGQRVHGLIQAMLAVNDMFVLARSRVMSFFFEDVEEFFKEHRIRYVRRVKIAGKSGYDHAVDFVIPQSETRPERLVQAFNAPSKDWITHYLFAVTDARSARAERLEAYAFLNDVDRAVSGDVVEALTTYDVKPAPWSRRNEFVEELAA